jgi:hypothetical protein
MKFLIGLPCRDRNFSDTGNCAMTSESSVIKKIILPFVLPRHSIERLPHLDFRFSPAESKAQKNVSGSTSYFTERHARYSPADFLRLKFLHLFPSHRKVTMTSQPFRLVFPVSPENVASLVRLKIPGRNQNDVAFPDPHSPLQLASNSAQPFFAVLALHQDSFSAQHLNGYAQHIVYTRQHHVFKVSLVFDFSFTHFQHLTHLHLDCVNDLPNQK